jgi:hypothetical protein
MVYFKGSNFCCLWYGSSESMPFGKNELTYENGSREIIGKEVTVEEIAEEILPFLITL